VRQKSHPGEVEELNEKQKEKEGNPVENHEKEENPVE
tara:strand:+ start:58 stop:168 length:111 start_codon:yes stop_codon:yes gene_type:complete